MKVCAIQSDHDHNYFCPLGADFPNKLEAVRHFNRVYSEQEGIGPLTLEDTGEPTDFFLVQKIHGQPDECVFLYAMS